MQSECCSASEWYGMGICSQCKENAEFHETEE